MNLPRTTAGLALLLLAGAQDPVPAADADTPQVRTLPECRTFDDVPLDWAAFDGRALVIYFHRPGLEYAQQGLRGLIDLFAADPQIAGAAGLVVVGFAEQGLDDAAREADVPGLVTRVVLDSGHRAFADYRAVAFPTAYVLDAERRELHVGRGYGPHFEFRIGAALRFATGALDEEGFRAVMDGAVEEELTPEQRREVRVRGLVRAMARSGEAEAARQTLEDLLVTTEAPSAGTWELAVRLRLAAGDADGAQRAMERLIEAEPEPAVLELLRCRMRLEAGEIDEAEAELSGVRARRHPEAFLLRGRILEARGDFSGAAVLYRERLERAVFAPE